MEKKILREIVHINNNYLQDSLRFNGFSTYSIQFFDDLPLVGAETAEWWRTKNGPDGDYYNYLKPEYNALVEDLCTIISKVDKGIETELGNMIGDPLETWLRSNQKYKWPIPHRWAALHSKGTDKRIDIQFFINLTSRGMRIGIYSGRNKEDFNAWNAFVKRLDKSREIVFDEIKDLLKQGYSFINTSKQDYREGLDGSVFVPSTADELYNHVVETMEFGILKIIEREKLSHPMLLEEILDCFVETRKMYEILQPARFSQYKRGLTNVGNLQRFLEKFTLD